MKKEQVKKANFSFKNNFNGYRKRLEFEIAEVEHVLAEEADHRCHHRQRGLTLLEMFKDFLGNKEHQKMLNEKVVRNIIGDLYHFTKFKIVKDEGNTKGHYERCMNLKSPKGYSDFPMIPFATITLKTTGLQNNYYGSKNKKDKIKPQLLKEQVSEFIKQLGWDYFIATEYSVENTRQGLRSILHYHVVIPKFCISADVNTEKPHLLLEALTHQDSRTVESLFREVFVPIDFNKETLARIFNFWQPACRDSGYWDKDLNNPDPSEFVYLSRDSLYPIETKEGKFEWSREQFPSDASRPNHYFRKNCFIQWADKHPKETLVLKDGKFFFRKHENLQKHEARVKSEFEVSTKFLLNHYRNVASVMPRRSSTGVFRPSNPWHRAFKAFGQSAMIYQLFEELVDFKIKGLIQGKSKRLARWRGDKHQKTPMSD